MRSLARANDAKIVRSRDAQCNTKELTLLRFSYHCDYLAKMTFIKQTLVCAAITKQFFDCYEVYLCFSSVTGESSPIIICGVLTVADLEDLRLDGPLAGRLHLLTTVEPRQRITPIL